MAIRAAFDQLVSCVSRMRQLAKLLTFQQCDNINKHKLSNYVIVQLDHGQEESKAPSGLAGSLYHATHPN